MTLLHGAYRFRIPAEMSAGDFTHAIREISLAGQVERHGDCPRELSPDLGNCLRTFVAGSQRTPHKNYLRRYCPSQWVPGSAQDLRIFSGARISSQAVCHEPSCMARKCCASVSTCSMPPTVFQSAGSTFDSIRTWYVLRARMMATQAMQLSMTFSVCCWRQQ